MKEFNFAPRAPAAQLPRAPTRQPWKPNREIRLAIVSWRLSISQTSHPAHCQTLELGHASWTTYFTVRCSNIYKCTSVRHPSHNRWDFYPAVIPASKLSPPVLISWLSEGGLHQHVPVKEEPWHHACHLPYSSRAAAQSKDGVFAFRPRRRNNQRSPRTLGVSTKPARRRRTSYGNEGISEGVKQRE